RSRQLFCDPAAIKIDQRHVRPELFHAQHLIFFEWPGKKAVTRAFRGDFGSPTAFKVIAQELRFVSPVDDIVLSKRSLIKNKRARAQCAYGARGSECDQELASVH